jgi:hypothetical protein
MHCLPHKVARVNQLFCPEDVGIKYPRKVSQSLSDSTSLRDKNTTIRTLLPDHTVSHPRKKQIHRYVPSLISSSAAGGGELLLHWKCNVLIQNLQGDPDDRNIKCRNFTAI